MRCLTSDQYVDRVLTGDSLRLMHRLPDGVFDAVVTDPPYGIHYKDGDLAQHRDAALGRGPAGMAQPIINDGPEATELFRRSLSEWVRLLKPGGCVCCCCAGGGGPAGILMADWAVAMREVFTFKQIVIWDKGGLGLGWHYRRCYEVVLVGQKPGAACRWFDTSHAVPNVVRGIRPLRQGPGDHPSPKPVELMRWFIRLHVPPRGLVLDSFAGGGPTALAAIRQGVHYTLIEIAPRWSRLARRRIRDEHRHLAARGLRPSHRPPRRVHGPARQDRRRLRHPRPRLESPSK